MHIWQLQEAKAKFTQLMNEAKLEPQIISRHGVRETVMISIEKFEELLKPHNDVVSFFRKSPLYNAELDLTRDKSLSRDIEL
jgi:prevent-host-death family protein